MNASYLKVKPLQRLAGYPSRTETTGEFSSVIFMFIEKITCVP